MYYHNIYRSLYFTYTPIELTPEQESTKLIALRAARTKLESERADLLRRITTELVDAWKAAGGCQNCYGGQQVVTWSTLDGPGWTEYGTCKECTEQSKKVGRQPGARWMGGYNAYGPGCLSVEDVGELADKRTEFVLLNTYDLQISTLSLNIHDEEINCEVERGKTVEVIKGRKVAKGTKGECIWIGPDNYSNGFRIGIKDDAGKVHWTSLNNVRVAA